MGLPVVAAPTTLEAGHARSSLRQERETTARIPLIGVDSGAIPGTKPGDSARALEAAGRDIVRARLHRNRFKPA